MTKLKFGQEIADRIAYQLHIGPKRMDTFYADMKNKVSISTLEVLEKLIKIVEEEKVKKSSGKLNVST